MKTRVTSSSVLTVVLFIGLSLLGAGIQIHNSNMTAIGAGLILINVWKTS